MDSVEELYAKLQLLSEQWRQNTSELGQLQEKAAELQDMFDSRGPDDDRIRFKELQKENRILSQLVKQHESTLEVVMSKFRLQTQHVQKERQGLRREIEQMLEEERAENAQLRLENARLAEHLARCVQTMRDAANADEEAEVAMLVAGLAKENETLRSMLIASLPSKAAQAFFPAAAKASLDGSLSSAAAAVSVHRTGR